MTIRLQVYPTPEITVTFDPTLCIHSGHCVRGIAGGVRPGTETMGPTGGGDG